MEILAFPCNQFGKQEPGTNAEIKKFATEKYGATFPLFEKVDVNGDNAHPVYKFLKSMKSTTLLGVPVMSDIAWNFEKFLIDRNGVVMQRYKPTHAPLDFEADIIELLKAKQGNDESK